MREYWTGGKVMQDITTQDIIVVAAACVVAWFIGKYIKRKNEREDAEKQNDIDIDIKK